MHVQIASHVPVGQLLERWSSCMTLMAAVCASPSEPGDRVMRDSWRERS